MRPRFKKGDSVTVNGRRMTITYWPEDNQNFFTATARAHDGGEEQFTYHVTDYKEDEQPITDEDVKAVAPRAGRRKA